MTIVEFLRARLDDYQSEFERLEATGEQGYWDLLLADIAAKRRIVDLHEGGHECSVYDHNGDINNCRWCIDSEDCSTMRLLAEPYDAHPDYDPAWRV